MIKGGVRQISCEDRPVFGQQIDKAMCRLGGIRVTIDEGDQQLYSRRIASHCVIGQPTEDHFERRDAARLAVFGYCDLLPHNILQDRTDAAAALWAAIEVGPIASSEPRRLWRAAIADLVVGALRGFP